MFLRHLLIAVHSTIPALQPIRKFEIITVFLSANLFQLKPRFFFFLQAILAEIALNVVLFRWMLYPLIRSSLYR